MSLRKLVKAGPTSRLKADYEKTLPIAKRLEDCLRVQLAAVLDRNSITLGVPMESRVKTWSSTEGKLDGRSNDIQSVSKLHDLVGVRLILLFRRDLERLDVLLRGNLTVTEVENTGERLADSQFGYQSNHYIVKLPPSWLAIPSYSDLEGLSAEVQVRTLAQHMWAAASHKLQYKREESVPPPLRRSIYRVFALLETVDLEFARVLAERDKYVEDRAAADQPTEGLNVDNLAEVLSSVYPSENLDENESYDEVLDEVTTLGIRSTSELRRILERHLEDTMEYDRLHNEVNRNGPRDEDWDRLQRGVYFTHCGLARRALQQEERLRGSSK